MFDSIAEVLTDIKTNLYRGSITRDQYRNVSARLGWITLLVLGTIVGWIAVLERL